MPKEAVLAAPVIHRSPAAHQQCNKHVADVTMFHDFLENLSLTW